MKSPLLALFIRSLREDSRLKLTYFARAGLVLLVLLFLAIIRSEVGWRNAPGLIFFQTVSMIDLCFVVLASFSYFAAVIAEEKEELTLGLLRMTNLNPLSILLGKSTSRLCVAVLLSAAQFPFTLLAITLGGITLPQILLAYLTIGAFLVFVSNLALLASVISRRTNIAAVLTGVGLLLFLAIIPIAGWLGNLPGNLGLLPGANPWSEFFVAVSRWGAAASPFLQMQIILYPHRAGLIRATGSFQIVSNLGLGLAFFLLAWLLFDRFCGNEAESAAVRTSRKPRQKLPRALTPGRAWANALAWKDFNFTAGGKRWVFLKLAAYGSMLIGLFFLDWYNTRNTRSFELEALASLALGFSLLCLAAELAFTASAIFRNEIQGRTLSSLAMLPQGLRRVAYEKLLGIVPALSAAGFYLTCSLFFSALSILDGIHETPSTFDVILGFAFYLAQALFFLHLVAALSLWLKRGALPLAIGIEMLLFIFLSWFFDNAIGRDSVVTLLTAMTFGATAFLHASIGRRLTELAGEE